MGIRFECPSCNKKIVVHDRFANRQMRCPACEFQIRVPTFEESKRQAEKDAARLRQSVSPEEGELIDAEPVVDDMVEAVMVERAPMSAQSLGAQLAAAVATEPPKAPRKSIRKEHDHAEEDLEWDITPMVDVAFLLLIFFMLTASFSIQKAIPTSAEEKKGSATATPDPNEKDLENFVIQIDEFNGYTVVSNDLGTQQATSKQELIVILKDLKLQLGDTQPRVIIQAHVDSIHGAVVACMDAARESEFYKFQVQAVEEFD